jgi:hypothetical protein
VRRGRQTGSEVEVEIKRYQGASREKALRCRASYHRLTWI